jgi:hypothetical protein
VACPATVVVNWCFFGGCIAIVLLNGRRLHRTLLGMDDALQLHVSTSSFLPSFDVPSNVWAAPVY